MKKIFTLLAMCLYGLAQAKETGEQMFTTAGPGVGGAFPHFIPIGGNDRVNNKVSLRLVGKTYLKHNGTTFIPFDSNAYTYSNDRGGIPDVDEPSKDENILFDNSYSYVFDQQFGNYVPLKHRVQGFTPDNKILSLVYASWKNTTATWKDSIRYMYGYNNGKMVSSVLELWYGALWTNAQHSTIQYQGNKVTKMESTLYRVDFTYDANNNLAVVVDQDLVSMVWQNKERKSYQYSGKDVTKYTLEKWDAVAGMWIQYKQWEYIYTGLDVTTETEYNWNGTGWLPLGKHSYAYDGSHNILIDDWQLWSNSFQNTTREEWTYNGQNLPEKVTTKTWAGTAWENSKGDFEYHFYYENYFPASVKDNAEFANLSIQTYPNPAINELHVALDLQKAAILDFSVINMNGMQVKHWNENVSHNYNKVVEVSDLPSGNYFVRVNADNQQLTKQFVVVK